MLPCATRQWHLEHLRDDTQCLRERELLSEKDGDRVMGLTRVALPGLTLAVSWHLIATSHYS